MYMISGKRSNLSLGFCICKVGLVSEVVRRLCEWIPTRYLKWCMAPTKLSVTVSYFSFHPAAVEKRQQVPGKCSFPRGTGFWDCYKRSGSCSRIETKSVWIPPSSPASYTTVLPQEMRGAETMTLVREPNCPLCSVCRCTNSGTSVLGGAVTDSDPASVLTAGSWGCLQFPSDLNLLSVPLSVPDVTTRMGAPETGYISEGHLAQLPVSFHLLCPNRTCAVRSVPSETDVASQPPVALWNWEVRENEDWLPLAQSWLLLACDLLQVPSTLQLRFLNQGMTIGVSWRWRGGGGPMLRGIHEVVTVTQLQFRRSVASNSVAIILKPSTAPDGQKKVLTECGLGERFLFLFTFHFILFCLK